MKALAVKVFTEWRIFYHRDGKDPDSWQICKFLCEFHETDDRYRQFMIRNGYRTEDDWIYYTPVAHWICVELCDYHAEKGQVGAIKLGRKSRVHPGKIATHFVDKCKLHDLYEPLLTFRYVKCICIVFVV